MNRQVSKYNDKNLFKNDLRIYDNSNKKYVSLNSSSLTNNINVDFEESTLSLNSNLTISGDLTVNGSSNFDNVTISNASISDDLIVSGSSTFNDHVTINSNLTVNGSATFIESTNLIIEDPQIKISK